MFEFTNPWFFLLFIPLTMTLLIAVKRRPATISFSDAAHLREAGAKSGFSLIRSFPDLCLFLAGAAMITALAGPRKGIGIVKQRAEGIDIILAIDVSGSMEVIDIPEKYKTNEALQRAFNKGLLPNRINVAKRELKEFVKSRPNDRLGLIAFAGLPFTVCPPTLDHDFLTGHLDMLKAGMFSETAGGTALASPIAIATNNLKKSDAKRRVMVLFTDGANTVDDVITPTQAAELANDYNVTIYTVGIGSERALRKGFFGRYEPAQSDLDESLLKEVAKLTDGLYIKAADEDKFKEAMAQISKLEKTTIIQPEFTTYKSLFPKLIILALILGALSFFLEHTFCLRIP